MTTQDIVKGVDYEALTNVTGAAHNQGHDMSRLASDKGMIIETTDTAGVPDVPNPATAISGIVPTWWTRYIWRRILATSVKLYKWDPSVASDPTYLQWIDQDTTADAAYTLANTAKTTADDALDSAESAAGQAQAAQNTANTAFNTANTALNTANITAATLAGLSLIPTGGIVLFGAAATFSTTQNQGWLVCDGSAVSRTIFSALFAVLDVTWGVGDGSTTFNLPDLRGRVVGGSGQGAGLTNRTLGPSGLTGNESVILTRAQLPAEQLKLFGDEVKSSGGADLDDTASPARRYDISNDNAYNMQNSTLSPTVGLSEALGSGDAHNNMQPTAFMNYIIKT